MSVPVVVIGGGFAGAAAACRLAGDGHRVILLERGPRLGGRAGGFHDRETGDDVDLGHHVSMRCCTATHGFLQRIGAASLIGYQSMLSVPILYDGGRASLRSRPVLPGPLHLAPGLLAYRPLGFADRLRVLYAGCGLLLDARGDRSFGDWLRRRGQQPEAIDRLWDPICVATLNARVDDVGLRAARKVLHEGFFSRDGAGLGLFTAPLARVFDAASAYVEAGGGEVRPATSVRRVRSGTGRVTAVELESGEIVDCAAAIAAIPPWDLEKIIADPALRGALDRGGRLSWAPIVDIHLWFDRAVLGEDFAVAVESPVQAVFDVSRIRGGEISPDGATHVVLSQSAAFPWVDRPTGEVADELLKALRDLLPAARKAQCLRRMVIVHRRATFVPSTGSDARRPSAETPIDGLYLAGDWTATGWPATIEGAIRSGIAAAARATTGQSRED